MSCFSDIDRLSDLPDYILHLIISNLDTKEACRTSILSKRWVNIWSTGLILEFNHLFENVRDTSVETSDKLVSFIETIMQQYSDKNLSIWKLGLIYPNDDKEMTGRIDRWLRIALENKVKDLSLESWRARSYELPMILFSAKSLISLKCYKVRVARYPSITLISLQSLDLSFVDVDEHMLHHIIMFCPLKKLRLYECTGITNLVIPNRSKIEFLDVDTTIPLGGSIKVETSSIQDFSYCAFSGFENFDPLRTFNFSIASTTRNLSVLEISCIRITDNVVDKLVSELSSIQVVSFRFCVMLKNIRISSRTLRKLTLGYCCQLANVALDAPQLTTFCYIYQGRYLQLSSVTSSHDICNARLNLILYALDTQSLVKINSLLRGSKCFKVLSIDLSSAFEISIDLDELKLDVAPYEVEELKLSLSCDISDKCSPIALLDGLFWSFRPTLLSFSITLAFDEEDAIIRLLLEILQDKVKCWKHPLKRIETQGTVLTSRAIDLRLRLFW